MHSQNMLTSLCKKSSRGGRKVYGWAKTCWSNWGVRWKNARSGRWDEICWWDQQRQSRGGTELGKGCAKQQYPVPSGEYGKRSWLVCPFCRKVISARSSFCTRWATRRLMLDKLFLLPRINHIISNKIKLWIILGGSEREELKYFS